MKTRTAAGLALMLASFPLFGAAGWVTATAVDQDERATRQNEAADEQCRTLLAGVGAVTDDGPDLIEVRVEYVPDPRKAMSDITSALVMCPARTLVQACVGDGCEGAVEGQVGMSFQLRRAPG